MLFCIQIGLSYGTCHNATKKLHLHPYKVSVVQELLPADFGKRREFCTWFNNNLADDNLLDNTFFSDEAWFHLSGYVNSQNYRHWSSVNPHVYVETNMHPIKVGVWCAMSRTRIIGPIFFHDTINAQRYRTLILEPFLAQLNDNEIQFGYFQQDGATAHTANNTIEFLEGTFHDRLISKNRWPPRSPDLTPLDFFLFGYLKNTIYRNRLHTLPELQIAITEAVNSVTEETIVNVFNSLKARVNTCLENEGHHFEHML